ncbi:MAG TPA: ABC transporter permease [Gemmatimonadaceae bacterium]|jgi:predicted permease
MRDLRALGSWLKNLSPRSRFERDMDKELQLHLELEAERHRRAGVDSAEAERRARVAFGGVEQTKEAVRDERGLRWLELTELRQAIRRLARSPMFTLASIALLALGLGGATVVFGALDVMYLRPPPFPAADRLAFVQVQLPQATCRERCTRDPMPDELTQWRPLLAHDVDAIGVINIAQLTFTADDGRHQLEGASVTSDVPSMLGFRTSVGRSFTADELRGNSDAILIGHDAWLHDFGGDSSVVGRLLPTESAVYRVIGVLAPQSDLGKPFFTFNRPKADFVLPPSASDDGASFVAHTILRLEPGVDMNSFRARALSLPATAVTGASGSRVVVSSLRELFAKDYRTSVWLVAAAVAVMLIVVCVNFAALVAARINARATELVTRVALGATRSSLTRMIAIESCLIVAAGVTLGLWMGHSVLGLARLLPAEAMPPGALPSVDARVIFLAAATAALVAIGLSVVPWMMFSPAIMQHRLRDAFSHGMARRRMRNVLLGTQVALAVVLLGGAGLLTRLFIDAQQRGTGAARHSVLYVYLSSLPDLTDDAAAQAYTTGLRDRVSHVPGIASVALSGNPLRRPGAARRGRGRNAIAMTVEGRADGLPTSTAPRSNGNITADYLPILGVRLLAGRWFNVADRPDQPAVALVDSVAAAHLFPGTSAIGHRIRFGDATSTEPWLTIVGVFASVHGALPGETQTGEIYRSSDQFPSVPGMMLVRTNTAGQYDVVSDLRRSVAQFDRTLTISEVLSVEDALDSQLRPVRFHATVIDGFAIFVLVITCLGIFAAVSYAASRRQREIAIKVALGARASEVIADVVAQSVRTVAIGVAIGALASVGTARLMRAVLYGSNPYDPMVYGAVLLIVVIAATVGAYIPARRAVNVDPVLLMRAE